MWKKIASAIGNNKPVGIFGCTALGGEIYETIKIFNKNAEVFFIDNSKEKQNSGYYGKSVFGITELEDVHKNAIIVLAGYAAFKEMKEQLLKIGVKEDLILTPEKILLNEALKTEQKLNRRMPKSALSFVVDLVEHCNLNCQNCDHFSPLAKEHYTDLVEFERDLSRLKEIFGDNVSHIDLEGGEPLLNKEIVKFIEVTHKIFPSTVIQIFTNGILLPEMSDEFWQACKKYKVVLEVTKYPINLNYDNIECIAKQNKVEMKYYSGGDILKTSWHKPLDLEGKQDKYKSFTNCYLANGECVMLKKGKLYTCTLIPNIETFNEYFGKNLQVTQKDYINIYDDVTAEDIFEFLCSPMPACRYCKVNEWTPGHEWHVSKYKIEEWT